MDGTRADEIAAARVDWAILSVDPLSGGRDGGGGWLGLLLTGGRRRELGLCSVENAPGDGLAFRTDDGWRAEKQARFRRGLLRQWPGICRSVSRWGIRSGGEPAVELARLIVIERSKTKCDEADDLIKIEIMISL